MSLPRHVLVVEDNPADVFLLEAALEHAGLSLRLGVSGDGLAALEYLRGAATQNDLPELTLLDLNMPRMDGFEVLAALRADPRFTALPVVVLTTSTARLDEERVARLGADGYLVKPPNFTHFLELAERLTGFLNGDVALQDLKSG